MGGAERRGDSIEVPLKDLETRGDVAEQQMRDRLRGALFGAEQGPVRVGRYLVLDKLGEGGLGVVHAAYDPELDRRVALKLVQPGRLGPRASQRMQREAQAMAKLAHPNVVTVHDVGAHEGGVFIAMELIDGLTLSRWVLAKARPWTEIRDVLVDAGRGLFAAHRQGLVHRDFKPGNVLIDREDRAHVLDFGLARAAEDDSDWSVQNQTPQSLLGMELTATGHVLGTPAYMAPEQFNGRADARSDQWEFCVTAYEAFFGARPFQGKDADELHRVVHEGRVPPPPPQSRVPGWMFKALSRGLSVDPNARFGSMEELLHAMQRDRRSRRIQWIALAGALGLSAVTAGATAYVMRPQATEEDRATVDELEAQARAAAEQGRFVYPSPDEPEAPTALLAVARLEGLEGPIGKEAQARADLLRAEFAANLAELGDQYWEQPGGMGFASDFYAAALVFDPEQSTARERSTLTPGELSVLRQRASAGEFSDAELIGAQPLAVLADPDPKQRTKKLARLYKKKKTPAASTSLHLERLLGEDAPVFMQRGAAASEPEPEPTPEPAPEPESEPEVVEVIEPEVGSAKGSAATTLRSTKRDRAAAMEEVKAARAALRTGNDAAAEQAFHRALGKDSSTVAALAGLSNIYFERSSFQKALKYAKRAVALSPKNASYRMQLGDVLFKVHRYDGARSEYEEAKKLGHKGADKALARLSARVGG